MGTGSESRRRHHALLFARNFFKHPRMLGSVIPSSRFLIKELVSEIDWKRARVLVEYGPGVGNITAELLRRMPADAVLFVFETNSDFVRHLGRSISDPRLHVVHGSAEEAEAVLARHGHPRADYVVSGIPFSTIPPQVRESILSRTRALLRPDGKFLVYQFSGAVLPYLTRTFRHVRKDFEPLNILPARLFYCTP